MEREHGSGLVPHLRVARPVRDLTRSAAMYTRGLGLELIGSFRDHDGFDGVMLGFARGSYHFELTACRAHPVAPAPTVEDLLVFYHPEAADWQAACERMAAAGFKRVTSFNPYWETQGATFEDPDGYRTVLQRAEWPGGEHAARDEGGGLSPYFRQLRAKVGHDLLLMPSVAAVIRNAEGRVLLQERSSGEGWSLPAGAIEPGETPAQAVCREVREETGLVVEPGAIIGVFGGAAFHHVYPNGDIVEYTITLYRCGVVGRADGPLDPETKSLRYFGAAEMPPLVMPYPREALFGGG
jgi:8-oxo-dGTP pyrophosphatase MutT (NUDIX family)